MTLFGSGIEPTIFPRPSRYAMCYIMDAGGLYLVSHTAYKESIVSDTFEAGLHTKEISIKSIVFISSEATL